MNAFACLRNPGFYFAVTQCRGFLLQDQGEQESIVKARVPSFLETIGTVYVAITLWFDCKFPPCEQTSGISFLSPVISLGRWK